MLTVWFCVHLYRWLGLMFPFFWWLRLLVIRIPKQWRLRSDCMSVFLFFSALWKINSLSTYARLKFGVKMEYGIHAFTHNIRSQLVEYIVCLVCAMAEVILVLTFKYARYNILCVLHGMVYETRNVIDLVSPCSHDGDKFGYLPDCRCKIQVQGCRTCQAETGKYRESTSRVTRIQTCKFSS